MDETLMVTTSSVGVIVGSTVSGVGLPATSVEAVVGMVVGIDVEVGCIAGAFVAFPPHEERIMIERRIGRNFFMDVFWVGATRPDL